MFGCAWVRGCSRGTTCNSVFPAACVGGAAENKQIIFKPSGHCPGGFSFCPRPDQARRCPFALPTWRGFSLAMPCKAFSGFPSGFYSSYIKIHIYRCFQNRQPRYSRHAMPRGILCSVWRFLWPSVPRFRFLVCRRTPAIFTPRRSARRPWCFPRHDRQERTAPPAAHCPTARPLHQIRFPAMFLRQG